jgi:hypothetical protein
MRSFLSTQNRPKLNVPAIVKEIHLPTQCRWKYVISRIGNCDAESDRQAAVAIIEAKIQIIATSRRRAVIIECTEIETADAIGAADVSPN